MVPADSEPSIESTLEWVTQTLLSRDTATDSPAATLFLLRRYVADGRDELRAAVENGLAVGLERAAAERDPRTRCQWLGLFADAAAVSDDDRLAEFVNRSLAATIDDLEQFVRARYEPGDGLVGSSLDDQLSTGLSLLTAFELTGRLPYSMLAEELLQFVKRTAWDDERGVLSADAAANSRVAQLMARIAALHRDPVYSSSAVVAEHPTYEADAPRVLEALALRYREYPEAAAEFGIALLDWFALSVLPN